MATGAPPAARRAGVSDGVEIRDHAPRGVTAPPPPCTPRGPSRWRHRGAAQRPWLPTLCPLGAALGGHRCGRRLAGMGRAAAGSPGRRRQRRRLLARRRRRDPRRRRARKCCRRRARPRLPPTPKSPGQVGARGRGKRQRQRVPRPGARGAPTPAGGVPTRWGTWRGSEHFLGLSVCRQMCPAVKGSVRL